MPNVRRITRLTFGNSFVTPNAHTSPSHTPNQFPRQPEAPREITRARAAADPRLNSFYTSTPARLTVNDARRAFAARLISAGDGRTRFAVSSTRNRSREV
jgi:hypothetical protein